MYKKEEIKQFKKEFWTAFGVIMKPNLSSSGNKINWINYKTGVKDVIFKLDADSKKITIGIHLTHKDAGIRELFFEQLLEFKMLMHNTFEEDWNWEEIKIDNYQLEYSSVSISTEGNIFDKNQWQEMFAFLKTRLLKLDEFWENASEIFKSL